MIARKACLSLVGVAFGFDARAQVSLGMFVLMVASLLHDYHRPFTTDIMNTFEAVSLATSFLTFFLGIFTIDAGDNGQKYVLHLIFMLYFLTSLLEICMSCNHLVSIHVCMILCL